MSRARRLVALAVGLTMAGGGLIALWPSWSSPSPTMPGPGPRVVVLDGQRLGFPGATGWRDVPCSDVAADELCQGQWVHDGGQVARVLLLPLPDPSKLESLGERLQQQATAAGGVASVVPGVDGAPGGIRLLQPMRDADRGDALLAGITYVVPAPSRQALHLLTSTVPLADQEPGDQRLRDLLAFGAWLDDGPDAAGDDPASDAPPGDDAPVQAPKVPTAP